MDKPVAAVEITTKSIKIVVGYIVDEKVYPIYAFTKPIGEVRKNDTFSNIPSTISSLSELKKIDDDLARLHLTISDCILVMPPMGLQIFQTMKTTALTGDDGKVDYTDIKNAFSLVKNPIAYNTANSLVDIIPDCFILDQGRSYSNPPLGESTSSLTIQAKVHTLPRHFIETFERIVNGAGIDIKRKVISAFGASELIATYPNTPLDYILVDIGANETVVSLIGNKQLYTCEIFNWGGDNLTHRIMEEFNISEAEAEKIKVANGLDNRKMNFQAPIVETTLEDGTVERHYSEELNKLLKAELENFVAGVNKAINNLLKDYNPTYKTMPMILIGGGALLKGLESYLAPKVQSKEVTVFIPQTLGCRNPSYVSCLGAMLVVSKYRYSFDENRQRVEQVVRTKKE